MQSYVCVSLCRYTGLWVHMHVQASTGCQMSFSVSLLILLRQDLSLKRKLSDWLESLASEPQEPRSLTYSTDYRGAPKPPLFMWVLRIEIRKVNSKPFTETSPQTPCNVSICAHVHSSQVEPDYHFRHFSFIYGYHFQNPFPSLDLLFFKCQAMRRYSPDLIRCIIKFENTPETKSFPEQQCRDKMQCLSNNVRLLLV